MSFLAFALTLLVADPPAARVVGSPPAVEVTGVGAVPPTLTVAGAAADTPAVAGTWAVKDGTARFAPAYPLVPGQAYIVTFTPATGTPVRLTVTVPKPDPGPPVRVVAVHPAGNVLPENALRWYVQFSAPVARGTALDHVHLYRADGTEVEKPFLDEELWSPDGTRLTVLFHPGRVKRELALREELGPVLEEGKAYRLVVADTLRDEAGRPLAGAFARGFRAGPADDQPVAPAAWAVMAPANPAAPLIVRLSKPHDHALLGRLVWVADAAGSRVPGTLTVGGGDRVLTFAPAKPWAKGSYRLVVDTRLEDVCGNRVGEAFQVDVFGPVTGRIEATTVERGFVVK